jgi:hypothetical protein
MERSEKRKAPREECIIAVNIVIDDKAYTEFSRNMSKGGMYIDSNMQIPTGRALLLTYQESQQKPTKRIGQVVWSDSMGMGIRLPKGGLY